MAFSVVIDEESKVYLNYFKFSCRTVDFCRQRNLHTWSLRTDVVEALFERYEEKAEYGLNTLADSRQLTGTVNHYAHAGESVDSN